MVNLVDTSSKATKLDQTLAKIWFDHKTLYIAGVCIPRLFGDHMINFEHGTLSGMRLENPVYCHYWFCVVVCVFAWVTFRLRCISICRERETKKYRVVSSLESFWTVQMVYQQ